MKNGIANSNWTDMSSGGSGTGDMEKSTYDTDNDGIVDFAETLDGMVTSITELNYLSGATDNIQSQINALLNGMKFIGEFATVSARDAAIASPIQGNWVIITADETKSSARTQYIYDGSAWVYAGGVTNVNDASNTVKGIVKLAGDLDGTADSPALKTISGVSGNYVNPNLTVDSKGRITAIITGSAPGAHANQTVLDDLGDDGNGNLTYNGNQIGGSASGTTITVGTDKLYGDLTLIKSGDLTLTDDPTTKRIVIGYTHPSTHSASMITDTTTKVMMTASERAQLASLSSDYLDMATYDSNGDGIVDSAETLDGMTASITEINYLDGVTSNIQTQLDALASGMTFVGEFATYADMVSGIPSPNNGDWVLVTADETHGGVKTQYINNGTSWIFAGGTSNVNDATNAVKGVIKLAGDLTGSASVPVLVDTGVTPGTYSNPQIKVDSKGRIITVTTSTSGAGDMTKAVYDTDDDGVIDKANDSNKLNGKDASEYQLIIAIQATEPNKTANLLWIDTSTIPHALKKYDADILDWITIGSASSDGSGLTIIQYNENISLANTSRVYTVTSDSQHRRIQPSVMKYITGATGQVQSIKAFNNSDASDFTYNPTYVALDGKMYLSTVYTNSISVLGAIGNGTHGKASINVAQFKNVEKIEVN
ncbi:MAG: hypothetical protein Q8880_12630 [Bacteroidota bacterium]|nr:hypothetical protein [Bacteroidota bacterium]